MEKTKIKEIIYNFIEDKFISDNINLSYNTLLLEEGIIHSSGILLLIMEIEKKFNIQIEDDELIPENFNTINILADLISKKVLHHNNKI